MFYWGLPERSMARMCASFLTFLPLTSLGFLFKASVGWFLAAQFPLQLFSPINVTSEWSVLKIWFHIALGAVAGRTADRTVSLSPHLSFSISLSLFFSLRIYYYTFQFSHTCFVNTDTFVEELYLYRKRKKEGLEAHGKQVQEFLNYFF